MEVGEKEVKVKASLRAILFSDQPIMIPLFKKETAVDKALVSGTPAILTANETGQVTWALMGKPGDEVNLELEFRSSVTQEGGFYTSVLNIPLSGAKLTVDFPYDEVQARLNDQYRATRLDERKHSLFDAWVMGKESTRLSWLPLSKSFQPSITSAQTIVVDTMDPRIVRYTGKLKLMVGHRPVTDLSLVMEEGWGGASVSGRNVASYRGNDNRLEIRFSEPVIGMEELSIAFTHPIQENEPLEFVVPHFQIEGANVTSGYIVFTQSSLYKATILEQEKVYPVAPDQVPDSALRNAAAQAFQFLNGDYRLKFRLEPVQPEFTAALYHGVSLARPPVSWTPAASVRSPKGRSIPSTSPNPKDSIWRRSAGTRFGIGPFRRTRAGFRWFCGGLNGRRRFFRSSIAGTMRIGKNLPFNSQSLRIPSVFGDSFR